MTRARFGRLGDALPAFVLVLLALAFGYLVWPTPWRRIQLQADSPYWAARENRFTGRVQFLYAEGWRDAR